MRRPVVGVAQVEEKFQEELTVDKAKYDRLMQDKTDMEAAYDARITAFEARQAREVGASRAHPEHVSVFGGGGGGGESPIWHAFAFMFIVLADQSGTFGCS
jgi:hypothetical protein